MILAKLCVRLKEMLSINPLPTAVESLSALWAEYGFVVESLAWCGAILKSERYLIGIEIDYHSDIPRFTVVPTSYADFENIATGVSPFRNALSLFDILRFTNPELHAAQRRLGSFKHARQEIERQFRLFMQYCSPLIEDDNSIWPQIRAFARSFRGPTDGETLHDWSLRTKQLLREALEKEDYPLVSEACSLLKWRRVELTREEEDICRMAKHRANLTARQ